VVEEEAAFVVFCEPCFDLFLDVLGFLEEVFEEEEFFAKGVGCVRVLCILLRFVLVVWGWLFWEWCGLLVDECNLFEDEGVVHVERVAC